MILFLVGPTAVGKTDVACVLVQKLNAEIVSCDAMQVYREISVLTNKASPETLKAFRHHLVGIISVSRNFNVQIFRQKALAAISAIRRRGRVPLVVGGSGLYMSVLLDGIFAETPARGSSRARKNIERQIREKGLSWAYAEVQRIDPAMAKKIHPHDARRMARVLEVFQTHGRPISELHAKRQGLWGAEDVRIFALTTERSQLHQRINARVEAMFSAGAVEEVRALGKKRISRTAQGIIGLKEIRSLLAGEASAGDTKELIKKNTRHFAKRQLTWLRKDKRIQWVEVSDTDTAAKIADKIWTQIKKA